MKKEKFEGITTNTRSLAFHIKSLMVEPTHIADLIEFLFESGLWQDAAEMLDCLLKAANDNANNRFEATTVKHDVLFGLSDLLTFYAMDIHGFSVSKPHTVWLSLAKLYEDYGDVSSVRAILKKAMHMRYRSVDHLATLWGHWAEMEMKQNNVNGALELIRCVTALPSLEFRQRWSIDPVQMKLHKFLNEDLVKNIGTSEPTCTVYDQILDLKIATPQIICDYARKLEEQNFLKGAFEIYEEGVKMLKNPHTINNCMNYISEFVSSNFKIKPE
ncbi:Pre-mrna-splicing factor syf1 [Thalictrum thalictroides]|uniref:Pre-mrna-splicing factor syf1 n=1 Tax=Thalictrum thalictroides TaxID=46969 RepID=A0A7J6WSR9_THATH|nr:Pre-mrna-splicing factor syf1 [Thalictrum thalictroides]